MMKPSSSLTSRLVADLDLTRLHLNERAALYEAAALIRSTLEYDQVLKEIAKQLCNALNATSAYILSFDTSELKSTVLAEYFSPHTNARERVSDLGKTYNVALESPEDVPFLLAGETMIHHLNDPGLDAQMKAEMEQYGVRSALTVPLRVKGETVAYTEIWESRHHREFSETEIALARGIAQHAAVAIENARLYANAQQNLREQTALRAAISAVTSTLDLSTVLSRIAEQMCLAVDATSTYICDWDPDRKVMTVLADHYSSQASKTERVSDLGLEYSLEGEEEFTQKMLLGIPDTEHIDSPDINPVDRAHLEQYGAKSVIYIPLSVHGDLTAIAELWDSRQRREFTASEIDLAKGIAQHGAVAIRHARLFTQTQEEIRERKRAEERLRHDALHDQLTGLPNRTLLLDRLGQALKRSRRSRVHTYALLFLDLDRFKVVNDSLGHRIGDDLLIAVGDRLLTCIRESDTVARFGGDEFIVLLQEVVDIADTVRITTRILETLSDPFHLGEHTVYTNASVGIVLGDERYEDCEDLLRDADIAMYRAKEMGRARYAVFDEQMHANAAELLRTESELREAIRNDEFRLHYQPIVELINSAIIGYEALIRWEHPGRGTIPPMEFIPLAEDTGLIIPIGYWVLWEACRQMAEWHQTYPRYPQLTISVNLSGRQLRDRGLTQQLRSILQETALDASHLALEITESAIIDDFVIAREILTQLKAMGVRIHMDDFGAGFSSLNVLYNLPIDTIKIDRHFVQNMETDAKNLEIVDTIIRLGSKLEKHVIAEGIEDQATLDQLRRLGRILGQGYLFSKPKQPQELGFELRTGTAPLPNLETATRS
jgi:diguanylate cyclase (GGDEF)-like protein